MSESKPLASLSPTLLARKGGARPAMRPQLQPMQQFQEATARQIEDDLGWNDMGYDEEFDGQESEDFFEDRPEAEIVTLKPGDRNGHDIPEVVRQQQRVAKSVAARPQAPRRSALADGRRAAFTLRLDAERHLHLRLACTLDNRSAQQMLIDALDKLIADMPEVASLASQVKRRN